MNENAQLIDRFYTAFAAHDAEGMAACYHPECVFSDPAFGELKGKDAGDMWRMLLQRAKGQLKVRHSNIKAGDINGQADWVAEYVFSQTGRPIVNRIHADFTFQDGKVIRHDDHFSLGKWARQAFGFRGWLISIFPFLQKKVRDTARKSLAAWQAKHP